MKKIFFFVMMTVVSGILILYSCQKELSCENCGSNLPSGSTNKPPIAHAGPDQTIVLPIDSVKLDGSLSIDPDGTITSYKWIKISGPASSNIFQSDSSKTLVNSLAMGVYKFELKVIDDKGASVKDTVQIIINDPSQPNRPPIANAGADQTITFPANTITLDGSGSTDPDNNITSYEWTNISGSSAVNIVNANAVQTQVTNLAQGFYLFELKVTDAGVLFSKDTVQINVNPANLDCNSTNRPQINAQLIPFGTLSKPRIKMAVASAGSKIVFAGGISTISNDCPECFGSSRVDIYDMVTQTWSSAELSVRRWGIAAVAAGDKIFFAGGEFGDGAFDTYYSTVDIYDVSTNTWSVASLSEPRSEIAAAATGNKVFFAGGEKASDYSTSAVVDIYDISADSWSTSLLSEQRSAISAVGVNNKIYFAGGANQFQWNNAISSKIDIYDNATNSWSTSSLQEPKAAFAGIAAADIIYWAGGYNGSSGWGRSCTVEIKNVNTQNSSMTNLFKPESCWNCFGRNAVLKNNKIVFPGDTEKFDIYEIATSTWAIGVLPQAVSGNVSIISVNNIIYVAGGNSNQVWKLEF